MNRPSIGEMFLGTAVAAILCGCGRNDGFGSPGGLIGGANGNPGGGIGGHSSTGASVGSGGSGGTGAGTLGGTGIGGRTSGGPAGSGTSGGTTGGKACQTLDDCPQLDTICFVGVCTINLCGPQGKPGPQNGALDSTCGVQGSNDGSCVPEVQNGNPVGLCIQGGAADGGCDPGASRPAGLGSACEAGDVCLDEPSGAKCFQLCDPLALGQAGCPTGDSCVRPQPSNSRLGVCQESGATSGTTGGTGGSTSGGSGDCNPATQSSEFQNCESAQCGCPYTCVADPVTPGKICEYQHCHKLSDCPDPATVCDVTSGICGLVACGQGTGNGFFNSTCTMPDGSAGTCTPVTFDGITSVGLCQLAGTATATCDPTPLQGDDPSQLCAPGSLCFGGFNHDNGTCNELCDPSGQGAGCPAGEFCSLIVDEPGLGICVGE